MRKLFPAGSHFRIGVRGLESTRRIRWCTRGAGLTAPSPTLTTLDQFKSTRRFLFSWTINSKLPMYIHPTLARPCIPSLLIATPPLRTPAHGPRAPACRSVSAPGVASTVAGAAAARPLPRAPGPGAGWLPRAHCAAPPVALPPWPPACDGRSGTPSVAATDAWRDGVQDRALAPVPVPRSGFRPRGAPARVPVPAPAVPPAEG